MSEFGAFVTFIILTVVIFSAGCWVGSDFEKYRGRKTLMQEAARLGHAEYCLKTNQLEWSGACDSELPSPPAR